MAIYKNVASQKLAVFAYTPADGAAKTGDAANITAYLSKDWGAAAPLADTNPTELDATNMPGWYVFDLAQTETDAEVLIVAPKSATAGVVLDQVQVFTLDATISSRASQSSVDDLPTVAEMNARTLPSADYFDPATDTVANVTTVGSVTNGVTVATNNDKTGYALTAAYDAAKTAAQAGDEMDLVDAPNATAIAAFQAGLALAATALSNATWTDERAALLDYLDAAISSRLAGASYTAPDNAALTTLLDRLTAARAGYLDKLNVTGTLAHSDAANTYKADVSGLALEATAQSIKAKTDALPADPADDSDIDAQLAAIAAYIDTEVAAILAAVDTKIAAIKAKTDSLTFTTAGKVDARVDNVAGTAVAGPNDLKADVSALATSAEIAALNDLSAADVRTQVDAALAAYDAATSAELTTAVSGLAAETTAQSIKAKTDQLTFTTPNKVDASAEVTVDAEAIAEAVAEVVGETVAAEVWEHTPRTLTSPATGADDSTTATAITRRRGDDWSIAVSSLELAGYQEVWFTIKRGYEALDTAAMLQVKQTTGLVRLNGAAPAAGEAVKASLAVNGTNDTATITVRAEATAQLPTGTFVYDLQWMDAAGDIHTVSLGTFTVSSDVTRATS